LAQTNDATRKIKDKWMLTAKDVMDIICEHVTERRPFSLIRLGDGEARLLGYPDFHDVNELQHSLLIWYGKYRPLDGKVMLPLKAQVVTAAQNANILGLPKKKAKNKMHRVLVSQLIGKLDLIKHEIAHCTVTREIQRQGWWRNLISEQDAISVIGCFDVRQTLCAIGVKDVRWYPVPSEAKYVKPIAQHYPQRHNELIEELERDVNLGDLFFVGAGPNGKVYCDVIKQQGGIAIDIGSVMDGWARVETRPYIKNYPERYSL